MAKHGEDRYYQRIGGSFLKMEHYAIADMFGRRRRPLLKVEAARREDGRIIVSILNEGRASAQAPYLKLHLVPRTLTISESGIDGNGSYGLRWLPGSRGGLSSQAPEFAGDVSVDVSQNSWKGGFDYGYWGPQIYLNARF